MGRQPQKLTFPLGRSGPPSSTWFLGSTRVYPPMGIWTGSAILTGLQGSRT